MEIPNFRRRVGGWAIKCEIHRNEEKGKRETRVTMDEGTGRKEEKK
jgi:hypothetical protein